MNKIELITKLIDHYEHTIRRLRRVKNTKEAVTNLLVETNTLCGFCRCSLMHFGIGVYAKRWVKNLCRSDLTVGPYPIYGENKKEVEERLMLRVIALKKELKRCT